MRTVGAFKARSWHIRYVLKLLGVRTLGPRDTREVLRVLAADPVAACMVTARIEEAGLPQVGNFEMWSRGGPDESLCFAGPSLMPIHGNWDDMRAFSERALRGPRACSSIVGRRELAIPLWQQLEPSWGPAREVRMDQPLLSRATMSAIKADPLVRRVTPGELDSYFAAAVEMFIEEVGTDPRAFDGGRGYRRRIAELIARGRAFARFEDGQVAFKCELAAVSSKVAQIQGVWVNPNLRGHGVGAGGTATVVNEIINSGRIASLYVNDYNHAARQAYARVGFKQVGSFATVMLD